MFSRCVYDADIPMSLHSLSRCHVMVLGGGAGIIVQEQSWAKPTRV